VQLKQTSWQNVVLGPKWETIDQVTGALGLNFAIVVTSHGSSERIIPQVGAITSYIRNLTSSHGLSMAELGRQTGFPRQTIYRIFRGRRTPHPVTQLKLLAALDCAVTYDFD
jgi:DNA-binding phage protein